MIILNNNPKKHKIEALSKAIEYIDSTIKVDFKKKDFPKDSEEKKETLRSFSYVEYAMDDSAYAGLSFRVNNLRKARKDYQQNREALAFFLKHGKHCAEREGDKSFIHNSFLKKYKYDLPIICSYFLLYLIWLQEAKVFLDNDQIDDEPFLDDLENPEEPEYFHAPKGTDRIKALSNALETLQPLATQEANESSLQNDYQQQRQWVEASLTQLHQKKNISLIKIFEYDLDFIHKHQKQYPLICTYLYISDLILHEMQLRLA